MLAAIAFTFALGFLAGVVFVLIVDARAQQREA